MQISSQNSDFDSFYFSFIVKLHSWHKAQISNKTNILLEVKAQSEKIFD